MLLKGKACFRGLGKNLREEIKKIQPDLIRCQINYDRRYVVFVIYKDNKSYVGTAICSVLDIFDEYEGKNKAAGRAVKAYKKGESSEKVRRDFYDFPNGWTIRQVINVINHPFSHKSMVLSEEETSIGC